MKFFRMRIENIKTGEVRTFVSKTQGQGPGFPWRVTCVLGYFEK